LFGLFKRKKVVPAIHGGCAVMPPLYFKDGEAAFENCCEYMECPLIAGSSIPALVLDSRKLTGARHAVDRRRDGYQVCLLRVASSDGGFTVGAGTSGPKGPDLHPGQLVSWRAHEFVEALAVGAKDKREAWAGVIEGTLKPEFVNGAWSGSERFYS
jgi:hypothetical protein